MEKAGFYEYLLGLPVSQTTRHRTDLYIHRHQNLTRDTITLCEVRDYVEATGRNIST